MKSQKNSFVTIAEQISLLNNNTVEILASLNDIVASQDSSINVSQLDEQGNETTYSLPTVGKLQKDINTLNNNVKRLSGLNDNSVHIIEGNSTKKIYLSDLNREPNKISTLNTVSEFTSTNNWFFESLINPTISVNFDLTDKVGNDVDGVISRRYMLDFEKDDDKNYTEKGQQARNEFFNNYVNKTDINLKDFLDWLTNPTNTGVVNNTTPVYDEQFFNFTYQEVNEHGIFSVLKQESDTINNKLWFHIYPFKYTTLTGEEKVLQKGDEVVLNREDSVTRWQILETSVSSSDFRVRLERIEGYDPIPTGTNILKFYGTPEIKKTANITVGFDENLVVFMKPTNSKNMIKGTVWSRGTGLYTNDLVLDTDNNISMSDHYLNTVYDYGNVLKDMIQKSIPSKFAITPDAPVLSEDNFKVVQINKHLTDTDDSKKIKDLHSQKSTTKTKLEQINNAITEKNKELSVKKYNSVAEKNKSQNELSKLVQQQESMTKLMYSITRQIKSQTDTVNTASAKFRLRGFWDFPEAKQQDGYREQEVIQFRIQYRYSSKTGTENQTEGYSLVNNSDANKTGYYSNWSPILTDIRKRAYDEETEEWTWEVEDVSDADTPNINQLDIPIQSGEKVEIRIKSISEVGYPDSKIESEWSEIMTIEFPDDLTNVLGENEFILQEAEQDNQKIEFEQTLDSKGINRHVESSFFVNEEYVAHTDDLIQSNYKDDQGNPFSVREYFEYLTNKITELESIIYSSKGKLKITLFNGSEEVEITNNANVNIDVECQKYGSTTDGTTFENKLYIIKDFYLKIENLSTSSELSFLVKDSYPPEGGTTVRKNENQLASLVDTENDFVVQEEGQYIYFCDNINNYSTYTGALTNVTSGDETLADLFGDNTKNPGLSNEYINKTRSGNTNNLAYSALGNGNDWDIGDTFASFVCPQVSSIDDLINISSENKMITNNDIINIPINIYFKYKTSTDETFNILNHGNIEHNKSLRVRLHPSSISGAFDFKLVFNIKRKNI